MNSAEQKVLELREEFQCSAKEALRKLNLTWIELEKAPDNEEVANDLLRRLHSLKGESKMLGFEHVSRVAHHTETLVITARKCGGNAISLVGDTVLAAVDAMELLVDVDAAAPPPVDVASLLRQIDKTAAEINTGSSGAGASPGANAGASAEASAGASPGASPGLASKLPHADADDYLHIKFATVNELAEASSELLLAQARFEHLLHSLQHLDADLEGYHPRDPERFAPLKSRFGELVRALEDNTHENGLRARAYELQARQFRLVPIRPMLQKYIRAVRDLSSALHKKVELVINDRDIIIDKQVVERLAEPLLHLVRNAVDHGIESPNAREAARKPAQATLTISAEQGGGQVVLTVADDGAGVDTIKVRQRAMEVGMLGPEAAAALSEDAALALLFVSGFSTRDKVSETSGRGVGLDVVRKEVEAVGGTVRIRTVRGKGTTFELRVPVSVLMTRMLLIDCAGVQLALPSIATLGAQTRSATPLEHVDNRECVRFRGEPVPIVDLSSLIGCAAEDDTTSDLPLVLVQHEEKRVALSVSAWRGEGEFLVKPLDAFFSRVKMFSGACVLPDGGVALALNPAEVVLSALAAAPRLRDAYLQQRQRPRRPRIVLAEDSAITRSMLARILSSFGYDVREAENGRRAIEIFDAEGCELMLTDIEMPEMDGVELVRAVRSRAEGKRLPVIVLSGKGSDDDKRRAAEAGADAYLVKAEFSESSLRTTIASRLGRG